MRKSWTLVAAGAFALLGATAFIAKPSTDVPIDPAPGFTLPSAGGKSVSLDDYKGKYVVIEWWNNGCPYVRRHYKGNMQELQKEFTADGAIWLTICPSAPGKQGHVEADAAKSMMKELGGSPTEILLNPEGDVARKYEAKTTPQMVLISPKGEILYNGGIDNAPNGRAPEGEKFVNYLKQAYAEAKAGKEISVKKARPYGCDVKYKS